MSEKKNKPTTTVSFEEVLNSPLIREWVGNAAVNGELSVGQAEFFSEFYSEKNDFTEMSRLALKAFKKLEQVEAMLPDLDENRATKGVARKLRGILEG